MEVSSFLHDRSWRFWRSGPLLNFTLDHGKEHWSPLYCNGDQWKGSTVRVWITPAAAVGLLNHNGSARVCVKSRVTSCTRLRSWTRWKVTWIGPRAWPWTAGCWPVSEFFFCKRGLPSPQYFSQSYGAYFKYIVRTCTCAYTYVL